MVMVTEINKTEIDNVLSIDKVLKCTYGDAATGGLLYLLCDINNNPLMKPCFCKDYFQDFGFGHSTNITDKGSIFGFDIKDHYVNDSFIKNNPTLVFYLYPGSKGSNGNAKKTFVNEVLEKKESFSNLNLQLDILESIFIDLGLISKKSEISQLDITINNKIRKAIKIEFTSEYLNLPETLSLFTLLLRNFLTFTMFKSYETRISDLNEFFKSSKTIPVSKYIYGNDVTIFSSDEVILKLPLILEGKISLSKNWDRYIQSNIYTIHNSSGIFSFITKNN